MSLNIHLEAIKYEIRYFFAGIFMLLLTISLISISLLAQTFDKISDFLSSPIESF